MTYLFISTPKSLKTCSEANEKCLTNLQKWKQGETAKILAAKNMMEKHFLICLLRISHFAF